MRRTPHTSLLQIRTSQSSTYISDSGPSVSLEDGPDVSVIYAHDDELTFFANGTYKLVEGKAKELPSGPYLVFEDEWGFLNHEKQIKIRGDVSWIVTLDENTFQVISDNATEGNTFGHK